MPWDVVSNHPGCPVSEPFGVVKFDGELEGCHSTQAGAEAQQAALYAAEPDEMSNDSNRDGTMTDTTRSIDEISYEVTPRQRAHYDATEAVAETFGKWGPGTGADGAHYAPVSPFANEGLVCSSCVFYDGARNCEVVEVGPEGVDPGGICKLWIIPEALVSDTPVDAPMVEASRAAGRTIRPAQERAAGGFPTDNLVRALNASDAAQFRASTTEGNTLFGHFAVFDTFTEIDSVYEGRFLERIAPGAFSDTFAQRGDKIRVLYDHGKDPSIGNKPLGVPVSFGEDARGAFYEVELFDTDYVAELRPALEAGQLGASFRFSVTAEKWNEPRQPTDYNPEMLPERTITGAALYEFGPVTFGAYDDATAGLRSRTDDFVQMLADPGFAVRLADRVGSQVVERLLTALPVDHRSDTSTDTAPADGRKESVSHQNQNNGQLTAKALTELARRQNR